MLINIITKIFAVDLWKLAGSNVNLGAAASRNDQGAYHQHLNVYSCIRVILQMLNWKALKDYISVPTRVAHDFFRGGSRLFLPTVTSKPLVILKFL